MESYETGYTSGAAHVRRYDVDWLRVLALGLLIVYHIVISFQPWAFAIFFIQNDETMTGLWPVMSMINVWRIPILFLVSGMGVRFAMERRNWKQLLKDRTIRILVPLVFGFFFICPISALLALAFYGRELAYIPNAGHLWFLGNIFLYVLLLLPLFVYLKKNPDGWFFRFASRLFRSPFALVPAAVPLMVEAWVVDPRFYTLYANTSHGFCLGLLCFMMGFLFVSLGAVFWEGTERIRHSSLGIAFMLYLGRVWFFSESGEIDVLLGLESMAWMMALLGYASRHLNRPSRGLAYLSKAVYPVYIVHLPVQYGLSIMVIPLDLSPSIKLLLLLAATFAVCLGIYEVFIKRVRVIRLLFGMKLRGTALSS